MKTLCNPSDFSNYRNPTKLSKLVIIFHKWVPLKVFAPTSTTFSFLQISNITSGYRKALTQSNKLCTSVKKSTQRPKIRVSFPGKLFEFSWLRSRLKPDWNVWAHHKTIHFCPSCTSAQCKVYPCLHCTPCASSSFRIYTTCMDCFEEAYLCAVLSYLWKLHLNYLFQFCISGPRFT